MWLIAHDRCWKADRLAKRGLSHLERCPHCNQEEETIGHLLLSCIFAREFWFRLLQKFGMQSLAPQLAETSFDDWWEKILGETEEQTKQGLNSVVILGAWTLWKHRNNCVFDGVPPNLTRALQLAGEELHFWGLAESTEFHTLPWCQTKFWA
jgi:hypothetical protein